MKKILLCSALFTLLSSCCSQFEIESKKGEHDLVFNDLATVWDEGMPLGNAFIGANAWQKEGKLRLAIDRIDLWDERPTDSLSGDNYMFEWVKEQWEKGTYLNVQKKLDHPYDQLAAPSKIPGAAIEFNISQLGEVLENRLNLESAILDVKWKGGVEFKSFVHASKPIGWFVFDGVEESMVPSLVLPPYQMTDKVVDTDPVGGQDLRRLEYELGTMVQEDGLLTYHQKGWGDAYYDVAIKYEYKDSTLIGVWSITSSVSDKKIDAVGSVVSSAQKNVESSFAEGLESEYLSHIEWWSGFWGRSAISIPDKVVEKQYYNEIYKYGCSTREDSYIIPLQSVWTADNSLLPPWKGDVHNDLNTQLSYWPTYTGNMCDLGMSYLNTLWNQRETNKKFTKQYFQVEGLNVPGVATLSGEAMGGWIQYAMSPTVSAWLSQHFYLHWRYTLDKEFLVNMGYPYLYDVATYLENVTYLNKDGKRVLPLSSSPEIYNNSRDAWFDTMTNYDLSLIWNALDMASEMASALNKDEDVKRWDSLKAQLPPFELDKEGGLMFAKDHPYNESHRHFSNAMAVMPLSIFDVTESQESKRVVKETIRKLDEVGPDFWCGYSYSWLANMKARALDGEGAYRALNIFATCFVLRNGFHVNGDQSKSGKSTFLYRPFTLEGNFAFASGVQEMLLQSHTDIVRVFPAIPDSWKNVSFERLRARGALVVSAERAGGSMKSLSIKAEKDTQFKLENPFDQDIVISGEGVSSRQDSENKSIYIVDVKAGSEIVVSAI